MQRSLTRHRWLILGAALSVAVPAAACAQSDASRTQARAAAPAIPPAATPALPPAPPAAEKASPGLTAEQQATMDRAARTAWRYMEGSFQHRTGLVNSVSTYPFATAWDMASSLAALYCGHALGLLDDAAYDRRMRRALETLRTMPLHENVAFNKFYSTRTGAMVDRKTQETATGYGWSALDIGRLLVWLKIVSTNEPRFAAAAGQVVARLRMDRLVRGGWIWGESHEPRGVAEYHEGRLGYEQYAARGFALWGDTAVHALDLMANARPVNVLGVTVLADRRGDDQLTGEPFFLSGLELGWTQQERDVAWAILSAQEARYRQTGQLTMVSEDAVNRPPYYFYYYCVYCNGRAFSVDAMGAPRPLNGPRWISAKAAYAWAGLFPEEYTWKAVEGVADAATPGGWAAGVYEGTGRPTEGTNLNTAAIILESVLYARRGRPLIAAGG